jgi:hypothetical protein
MQQAFIRAKNRVVRHHWMHLVQARHSELQILQDILTFFFDPHVLLRSRATLAFSFGAGRDANCDGMVGDPTKC